MSQYPALSNHRAAQTLFIVCSHRTMADDDHRFLGLWSDGPADVNASHQLRYGFKHVGTPNRWQLNIELDRFLRFSTLLYTRQERARHKPMARTATFSYCSHM